MKQSWGSSMGSESNASSTGSKTCNGKHPHVTHEAPVNLHTPEMESSESQVQSNMLVNGETL